MPKNVIDMCWTCPGQTELTCVQSECIYEECKKCHGTGWIHEGDDFGHSCEVCDGKKFVLKEK